jgi:arylsulfatase A-like enzyme
MQDHRPNILFIMSDDHAAHAMSCYGSRINQTPNMDRIAQEGMRLDNCFCTNSICAPSRATILTGKYSHLNGVRVLGEKFDGTQQTLPKLLQQAGYQTAIIGKWHLGHGGVSDPMGFDYWNVLPGQGDYHNPKMYDMGVERIYEGYVTDIITDLSIDWIKQRNSKQPFMLMCHHKAPHRPWLPDEKHAHLYDAIDIPEPETFNDDYCNRAAAAAAAKMRVENDLTFRDVKAEPPAGLSAADQKSWYYQRYIKDYLRCVASVDDNVGRLLDYLDETGLSENTVVIYTSDQGFFLGDHGWYDKRFFYEESLRMPFVIRYPKQIQPGSVSHQMILNIDFAPTLLDLAGAAVPSDMQGRSFASILRNEATPNWRISMYYRYYMHLAHHNVYAHYGVRTDRFKLIYYYVQGPESPEWELFDLEKDPHELYNVFDDPAYQEIRVQMQVELHRLRLEVNDTENPWDGELTGLSGAM